jgi:hypothetical protein
VKKLSSQETRLVKVLITGSRHYSDYNTVSRAISIIINDLALQGCREIVFMQGAARGADRHAVEFLNKTEKSIFRLTGVKIKHESYPPDLRKYGSPSAYHIRNQKMIDEKPVHALVFLERGEANGGTLSTVKRLKLAGIPFTPYGAVELLDSVA